MIYRLLMSVTAIALVIAAALPEFQGESVADLNSGASEVATDLHLQSDTTTSLYPTRNRGETSFVRSR